MPRACKRIAAAILFVLLAGVPAWSADESARSKAEIARWVQQLAAADFAAREQASGLLWKAGKAAEPALREALKSDDAEVVRRAGDLLDKFKWGIYPDTPVKVVEQIKRYQAGDPAARLAVVKELFELGAPGCLALVKIAGAENDVTMRQQLFAQINQEASRAIPLLLADRNFATLDKLLELSVATDTETAVQGYAVYWLLRGRLDERIAHYRALAEKPKATQAAVVLTYLYRARGDLLNARWAAERTERADLVEMVLTELRDWKTLAGKKSEHADPADIESLGFQAAYHRLAGNVADYEKAVASIRTYANGESPDESRIWYSAKALFLNDRTEDGIAQLAKRKNLGAALEILCTRLQFRDAFALIDKAKAAGDKDSFPMDLVRARALCLLGEKEQGLQIFTSLGKQIAEVQDASWLEGLVRTEYRLDLKEMAFEHAARVLAKVQDAGVRERLLGLLFPRNSEAAQVWWTFLRQQNPGHDPPAALKNVQEILSGKVAGAGVLETWIGQAKQAAAALNPEVRERWLLALGEAWLIAGKEEQARELWEKAAEQAASPSLAIRLGDLLAEKKLWKEAAERYRQGWEKDRKQPLPLYLQGWALAQSGQEEQGRQLKELAHWLPLGNENERHAFALALSGRDQKEAALRERELLARTSAPGSYFAGEALRQLGFDALSRKDYLKAAEYTEQAMLHCLRMHIFFLENAAYVVVPYQVHSQRALGLLSTGSFAQARQELRLCQAILPGNVELPIRAVPELEKQGLAGEARALFNEVFVFSEEWSAAYPHSALAHNNLAWLAACCRRELDKGLEHAREAVKLAPDNAGYCDTLAEVHFQRGDKEKAIELMKKCIALDSGKSYFRKQLKRFEAGDPRAPLPESVDGE